MDEEARMAADAQFHAAEGFAELGSPRTPSFRRRHWLKRNVRPHHAEGHSVPRYRNSVVPNAFCTNVRTRPTETIFGTTSSVKPKLLTSALYVNPKLTVRSLPIRVMTREFERL